MKTATSKVNANRSSKRSHALKELLEKQEANLLEIRENLPFEADSQTAILEPFNLAVIYQPYQKNLNQTYQRLLASFMN